MAITNKSYSFFDMTHIKIKMCLKNIKCTKIYVQIIKHNVLFYYISYMEGN